MLGGDDFFPSHRGTHCKFFCCSCSNKAVALNLTHFSSYGAVGHASLPPLNQIKLSTVLLEYLIFPFFFSHLSK